MATEEVVTTGDRYLNLICQFVDEHTEALLDGSLVLCLNPVGLHYVQSRLDALGELERLRTGAPVDYLRAYIADLGDHRALERLGGVLRLLTAVKVVSVVPRDPSPLTLLPFGRLRSLELRGCNLSTSAARGLLELRPILEKLRCHNSADALRYIFAERTVEIQDAQVWSKLSSVSCADNDMLLMDDSLQLLPAVEFLDLSRNRFAKVGNLHLCNKLKYLDLAFNHLRSISCFAQVKCKLTKLILKNNALATMDGIQYLITLEDLDLSYNNISDFNEIEALASLQSLERLWLKGNPITYTAFYREEVFGFFSQPSKVTLDGKKISRTEKWTVGVFISTRQKHNDIYGCYAPPENVARSFSDPEPPLLPPTVDDKSPAARAKRKMSRLASIQEVQRDSFTGFDGLHGLGSHRVDYEAMSATDMGESDGDKAQDLSRDSESDSLCSTRSSKQQRQNGAKNGVAGLSQEEEEILAYARIKELPHVGENAFIDGERAFESSRLVIDSLEEAQEDDILVHQEQNTVEVYDYRGDKIKVINNVGESRTMSGGLVSPPHYREDMLYKRQDLEQELLRRSFDSGCAPSSSDSETSDDDTPLDYSSSSSEDFPGRTLVEWRMKRNEDGKVVMASQAGKAQSVDSVRNEQSPPLPAISGESASEEKALGALRVGHHNPKSADNILASAGGENQVDPFLLPSYTSMKRGKKSKPIRRVVSLDSEDIVQAKKSIAGSESDADNFCEQKVSWGAGINSFPLQGLETPKQKCYGEERFPQPSPVANSQVENGNDDSISKLEESNSYGLVVNGKGKDPLKEFFWRKIGNREQSESCLFYVKSGCIRLWEEHPEERDIYLLKSSENKFYIVEEKKQLSTGAVFQVQASHSLEDVRSAIVGLGLQAVRVNIGISASYLFVTRDAKISQDIIDMMRTYSEEYNKSSCQVKSWEHVQLNMFENNVVGGAKPNIRMYVMLHLLNRSPTGEAVSVPRSLVLTSTHIYLCVEELTHFGEAIYDNAIFKETYFSLESWALISALLKLVYKPRDNKLSLMFERLHRVGDSVRMVDGVTNGGYDINMLELSGIPEETIKKLITLFRAGYLESTCTSLPVENCPQL